MPPPLESHSPDESTRVTPSIDERQCAEYHGELDERKNDDRDIGNLARIVQGVHLTRGKDRENPAAAAVISQSNGTFKRETSFEDDRNTHLSNSSTKPTSVDSKSMASVTTFAMDEKESLRPDDSASVQAIDEEESPSGPASGAPNSLIGSEIGARGPQKPRAILRNFAPLASETDLQGNGSLPVDSESHNSYVGLNLEAMQGSQSLHGFPLEPDQKLLDAMKTPKDRLLILQLEEKITHFIRHSQ